MAAGVSDGILGVIDGALSDWSVSKDAMRWSPGAGEAEARSANSADFSYAMLPPGPVFAQLDTWAPVMTPAWAHLREGDIVTVDGLMDPGPWRIASREDRPDGTCTIELEEAGPSPAGTASVP